VGEEEDDVVVEEEDEDDDEEVDDEEVDDEEVLEPSLGMPDLRFLATGSDVLLVWESLLLRRPRLPATGLLPPCSFLVFSS
jgi:hypothetical protein